MRSALANKESVVKTNPEGYFSVLKGVRPADASDINFFVSVLGDKAKEYLDSIGASLFVFNDLVAIKSKSTVGSSVASTQDKAFGSYVRTNFVTIIDNRVVTIPVWRKEKKRILASSVAHKITQIDFMFLEDWIGCDPGFVAYKKEKKKSKETEEFLESVGFLLKMKKLLFLINSDCIIQLSPATKQRGRILQRHLKGLDNIRFLPVQI